MGDLLLDRNNVEDIMGLSHLQLGMLYHMLAGRDREAYAALLTLELAGELNPAVFQEAWESVAAHNELLRTVYRWEGLSNPVQIVLKDHRPPFVFADLSEYGPGAREELERRKKTLRARAIDIRTRPVELVLCKLARSEWVLFIHWHHLVYDGWSNGILVKELLSAYDALSKGKQPEFPGKGAYKEFIKWCRQQDGEEQRNFWSGYLQGFTAKTPLPAGGEPPAPAAAGKASYTFLLPEEVLEELNAYLPREETTLAAFMYGVWAVLLHKYTMAEDIVFGVTVSGRHAELLHAEDTVGLFINTLPLRIRAAKDMSLGDIIRTVSSVKADLTRWEWTDLMQVKALSGLSGNEAMFDSVVVVENYPVQLDPWLTGGGTGLTIHSYDMEEATEFPLGLGVLLPHVPGCRIEYDTGLFSHKEISAMAEHLVRMMRMAAASPGTKLSEVDLLTDSEKERMLREAQERQADHSFAFDFD